MTLIKSISGIRGTIGGNPEDGLNPLAIVKFVAAYATFIKKNTKVTTNKIVVGRDARISGPMVKQVLLGGRLLQKNNRLTTDSQPAGECSAKQCDKKRW